MKNLHLIKPAINISDEELSVIAYIQAGHENGYGWQFQIRRNKLYSKKNFDTKWTAVLTTWYIPATMRVWKDLGKPAIDFSQIEVKR